MNSLRQVIQGGMRALRVSPSTSAANVVSLPRAFASIDAPPTNRLFQTSPHWAHGGHKDDSGPSITVTFVDCDGEHTVSAPIGHSLLEVAHRNEVELEGACEGSLACSTCHVIVEDQDLYDKLEEPDDDENDMLDLAFGLTETSRLGCQIIAAEELDGLRVRIPSATRNFAVDGFKPKPH
mmetsp:Transcript_7059/g.8112  ORF Transcript_7059/g.8112 Transcript_7059/m.8112 type:complete len:180 (-) Transcript_7059:223-762(-)|eukprot:CAMPEP_0197863118 /NCGR_PEP_ID=MMETSP1438-20131217/40366_1 /TAXON_ID=1461541 /ORGANISM="Pterosperma sp., Strain CCMP1384" /LENGTH=179 /DNA_ID=CAMNT_0043480899 /DNA_START=203 /DNA_END=742 /DNA_ORIENTATION=+